MRQLFTPFHTTKAPGVGTGLGLSICHRIVTGIGGQISVDTRTDKGTTFEVLLPFSVAEFDEKTTQPMPRTQSRRRGRVLVVDDDPMIGRVVERALRRAHDVVTVSAGTAAIDLVKHGERFDVVLCDLMMPETSGMDVYNEIQQLAPQQADAFVFLTGGAFTSSAQAFLDEVRNLRLDKPFDPAELSTIVGDLVR